MALAAIAETSTYSGITTLYSTELFLTRSARSLHKQTQQIIQKSIANSLKSTSPNHLVLPFDKGISTQKEQCQVLDILEIMKSFNYRRLGVERT
jgi:hypothetical protein